MINGKSSKTINYQLKKMKQCSNLGRVMETQTIGKNGASPKSQMSRKNQIKVCKRNGRKTNFKMNNFFSLGVIALLLSSCATSNYYQVYKVQPINDLSKSTNSLIYEDTNCEVRYDFWGEGGNVGFLLYNKSDKNIYVNMKESFFIYNGIAYDYYKNREFTSQNSTSQSSMYTNSASNRYSAMGAILGAVAVSGYNYQGFKQTNSISAGVGTSKTKSIGASKTTASSSASSSGVNIKEKDIICIPPKSAKIISEYNINESLYRDCNLFLYPSKRQIRTSVFSEKESPFVFSNRILYFMEEENTPIKIEHKFYVSEISNFLDKDITEEKMDKVCEDEPKFHPSYVFSLYFKNPSPDKFYIKYSKEHNMRKH
jgi:hypothetical protein